MQYIQDSDDTPPCGMWDGINLNSWPWHFGLGWAGQVYPFVRETGVFVCPEDRGKASGINFPVSYAYNGNLPGGVNNTGLNPAPLSAMTQPSRTILFTEGTSPAGATYAITSGALDNNSPACDGLFYDNNLGNAGNAYCEAGLLSDVGVQCGFNQELASPPTTGWHFGGSNFAFLDGHVKWLQGSQVSPGENPIPVNSNAVQAQNTTQRGYAAGTNGKFLDGVMPAGTYSIT